MIDWLNEAIRWPLPAWAIAGYLILATVGGLVSLHNLRASWRDWRGAGRHLQDETLRLTAVHATQHDGLLTLAHGCHLVLALFQVNPQALNVLIYVCLFGLAINAARWRRRVVVGRRVTTRRTSGRLG